MKNCIGLAAGFDKNAEGIAGMLDMGFGFVEAGTVTPKPQAGNPKPRVFRIPEQGVVINRYGFNSDGHAAVEKRLKGMQKYYELFRPGRIVGLNVGKNKTSPHAVRDYVQGIEALGPYADYLVVNVSSPNTPGLRNLQNEKELRELLGAVVAARDKLPKREPIDYFEQRQKRRDAHVWTLAYQLGIWPMEEKYDFRETSFSRPALPPVLVKIAPDVSPETLQGVATVVRDTKVDGVIISNTTIRRDFGFEHKNLQERGGLSGRPLKEMSTKVIGDFYKLTNGEIPIVGVGGVSSGEDALEKIKAGASVVQLYTALAYGGPGFVTKVKRELAAAMQTSGYSSVQEAIGADHRISGGAAATTPTTGGGGSSWFW
eukprot:jgi/Bigna1/57125/fgenesh1_pm.4_\